MKIPLIKPDLPALEDIREPLEEILANGRITNFGKYVGQFENETAGYLNAQTVAVSSGTAGLVFTLAALGLSPGQKVVIPSFTFVATAQAVLLAGGVPLFAEIEDDLNISVSDLERLLDQNEDIGAVIAVHMYGLPANAQAVEQAVATASSRRGRKIPLIFDAAHAFGSAIDGRRVGSFGDAEVFSLSVTKVLVTVEGGLVATRNVEVAGRIKCMRNYGIHSNYNAHYLGMNGKMSEMHAIVGLHNLRRVEELLATRQQKARMLREKIQQRTQFQLATWPSNVVHTFKDFTILVAGDPNSGIRDRVISFLSEQGVETRAYFYPPVHEQTFFRKFATRPLPATESLSRRVITLPFFTSLTEEQMDYMVQCLITAEQEVMALSAVV